MKKKIAIFVSPSQVRTKKIRKKVAFLRRVSGYFDDVEELIIRLVKLASLLYVLYEILKNHFGLPSI